MVSFHYCVKVNAVYKPGRYDRLCTSNYIAYVYYYVYWNNTDHDSLAISRSITMQIPGGIALVIKSDEAMKI